MELGTIELQKAIVIALIQAVPTNWTRILASYEIEDRDDGRVEDSIVVYVFEEDGQWKSGSLEDAPRVIEDSFLKLFESESSSSQDRWNSTEVTIDNDGSFKFKFSYDPPKRINGVYDEDSSGKFDHYAEVYQAEKAAAG